MDNFRIFQLFVVFATVSFTSCSDFPFEPLVAYLCGRPAKYLTSEGWMTEAETGCITNPDDILMHCKTLFPQLNITNVVELDRNVTINNWCNFQGKDCEHTFMLQPIKCLVSPFVMEEILVSDDGCVLDNIIHSTECKTFGDWKREASSSCSIHQMELRRSSVLQPCDVGQFGGIQFVCCPTSEVEVEVDNKWPAQVSETSDRGPASEPKKEQESEHDRFNRVKAELKKKHDQEFQKIMDSWDRAQHEVEKVKNKDPDIADVLEKKVKARFEKTIDELDEKERAERRNISDIHEQLVQMKFNEKKRKTLGEYMALLSQKESKPSMKELLHALKHYVVVEQRERMHLINHYRVLNATDPSAAEASLPVIAEHLTILHKRVFSAIDLLNRVPEYEDQIREKIAEVLDEYGGFNDLEMKMMAEANKKQEEEEEEEEDEDHLNPASHVGHVEHNGLHVDEQSPIVGKTALVASAWSVGATVASVFASIFLVTMVTVGVIVWRRRVTANRRRRNRMRIDPNLLDSPELVHIAGMQQNGYENPTYKYFEGKTVA